MIMCKATTGQQSGILVEVPIEDIRRHKILLGDDDDKVADTVGDLVKNAVVKGTKMVLENNWHDIVVE